MPCAGRTKPESPRRRSDLVSVGLSTLAFPPEVVDEVIAETGRREQRHRSSPAGGGCVPRGGHGFAFGGFERGRARADDRWLVVVASRLRTGAVDVEVSDLPGPGTFGPSHSRCSSSVSPSRWRSRRHRERSRPDVAWWLMAPRSMLLILRSTKRTSCDRE